MGIYVGYLLTEYNFNPRVAAAGKLLLLNETLNKSNSHICRVDTMGNTL